MVHAAVIGAKLEREQSKVEQHAFEASRQLT